MIAAAFGAYVLWVKRNPGAAFTLTLLLLWVQVAGSFVRFWGLRPGESIPATTDAQKAAAFEDALIRADHAHDLTAPISRGRESAGAQ